jgi:hypothetical protein
MSVKNSKELVGVKANEIIQAEWFIHLSLKNGSPDEFFTFKDRDRYESFLKKQQENLDVTIVNHGLKSVGF